jgi:hypothetical protein
MFTVQFLEKCKQIVSLMVSFSIETHVNIL